jgi:prepilin-type N-terminal cleavage/methylation domain-containing protein
VRTAFERGQAATRSAAADGFTLVELLVALAVAGIALTAGFAALATLQDRTAYATEAGVLILEGASTRAQLIDWIAGARLQDSRLRLRFQGLGAESHALPSDELYVPTTARTPLNMPVTLVRLYLDRDPVTPERGLVAELLGRQGDLPTRMELIPQVTEMRLRYLPDVDGPMEWTSVWEGQEALPRAVELTLVGSQEEPLPPLLSLPIRVALATLR